MKIIENNGILCVCGENEIIIENLYVGVRFGGEKYNTLKSYENQKWTVKPTALPEGFSQGVCYTAKAEDAKITAVFRDGNIFFQTEYYNKDAKYVEPDYGLDFVALGGIYKNRIKSVKYNELRRTNGVFTMEMQSESGLRRLSDTDSVTSGTNTVFTDEKGKCVDIGFVRFENYFTAVKTRGDGLFECQLCLDSNTVKKDKTYVSDWFCVSFAPKMQDALSAYAGIIKEFNNIELRFKKPYSGFCTWYYYMGNINSDTVFDNVAAIDRIRDKVPLQVFQIDDGWGNAHGDDGSKNKFPEGMKFYAEYIKNHNLVPGIWIKPFDYGPEEETVKNHPEWFLHDGDDLKLINNCAILDATNPAVKEYIKDLFEKITVEWGYRYIKIDIITPYLTDGDYYDKNAGALQNLRSYFKSAREGCHPDTFILACTSPILEMAGLADGVRTSGDVFENWESLLSVFRQNHNRYFTNGILFHNDPDCLMLRTKKEEDGECMRLCSRTAEENRTFATAMYVAGGTLMISDKLTLANEKMISDYGKFFSEKEKNFIPIDYENGSMPSMFISKSENGDFSAAFINWTEKEKEFSLEIPGEFDIVEHWDNAEMGRCSENFSVKLKPHNSLLLDFNHILG